MLRTPISSNIPNLNIIKQKKIRDKSLIWYNINKISLKILTKLLKTLNSQFSIGYTGKHKQIKRNKKLPPKKRATPISKQKP